MSNPKILGFLIVLAITIRAAAVLVLQSPWVPRSTYEHGEIAANIVQGKGFWFHFLGGEGPTSQQAPVYPTILAGVYWLGGVETPQSLLILELGQAVLGGVLVWGVWSLAWALFPSRLGASLASLLAALHPTLVYAATHVQVASLAATLLVWVFVLAYRSKETQRWPYFVATGAVLGILILTDPILALAFLGVVGVFVKTGKALRWSTTVFVVASLVVAPWIIRNAMVHGELVFVKSTFGYAFWQGNCRLSQGTDKVVRDSTDQILQEGGQGLAQWNETLWKARHDAGYLDDIALTRADHLALGSLSEPGRSRVLFRRALKELQDDPLRYPQLCLRRLRYFLLFDETNPKTKNMIYRVSHLGLTLAAIAGLFFATRPTRQAFVPTFLVAFCIIVFHTLTIVSARFHIPLEPLMAIWAGVGAASGLGAAGDTAH